MEEEYFDGKVKRLGLILPGENLLEEFLRPCGITQLTPRPRYRCSPVLGWRDHSRQTFDYRRYGIAPGQIF
jgi:hypothetical protein